MISLELLVMILQVRDFPEVGAHSHRRVGVNDHLGGVHNHLGGVMIILHIIRWDHR